MEGTFKSPRPIPTIVREATFSHRKPKRNNQDKEVTEDDCLPPRAPVKSAPPISRVFKHTRGDSAGALQVSFRENGSSILLKLNVYCTSNDIQVCCTACAVQEIKFVVLYEINEFKEFCYRK